MPKVPDAKYKITDISLEYEIATQPDLVRSIRSGYQHMALLYDRILRHRKIIVNKKDTVWNWAFNMPCKSLKGILVLFEEERSYTRDTSKFYNPKIQKVSVIVEGKPNQLYAQGMRLLSNMTRFVNISLKEYRETMVLMKLKSICNFMMSV